MKESNDITKIIYFKKFLDAAFIIAEMNSLCMIDTKSGKKRERIPKILGFRLKFPY